MKYIELFKNGFDKTLEEKIKPENRPYIGYSPNEGLAFTIVPEPYFGPADNEIWYTSTDGNIVTPDSPIGFGDKIVIVSNTYENGKGVITFDGEITMVGSAAFNACNNLASIIIPNSTTYIAVSAFYYCKSLTSVTIPNSVTSIGDYAFAGCSGLTSVTIPNSVTSIGLQAFYSCSGLTSIIYEGTQEQWNVITKGNYWNLLVPANYVQCSDGQVAL